MRAVMHLVKTARPVSQTTILVESIAFVRLDGQVGFVKVSLMYIYSFQVAEFGGCSHSFDRMNQICQIRIQFSLI